MKYLISHYFYSSIFYFYLLIFYIISFILIRKSGPYESSKTNLNFNTNIDPEYIVHLTDLHFHHLYPERTEHLTNLMKNISNLYNPKTVIITGDLVDASNIKFHVYYHQQFEKNWIEFNKSLYNSGILNNRTVLTNAGNHDIMVVKEDSNEYNPYRRYNLKLNESFLLRKYFIKNNFKDIQIILFNPLTPPMTSGPLGLMPFVNFESLNQLEDSFNNSLLNIYTSHYPFYTTWSFKSKSGLKINDIITQFDSCLTGHYHPDHPLIIRNKNTISVVTTPSFQKNMFSINIIDHGISSIHVIDSTLFENLLISYPIKFSQLTSKINFSLNSFPIRVLYFGNNIYQNFSIYIDSKFIGNLNYLREIRNSVHLFSFYIENLSNGFHYLKIHNNEKIEFFIGEKTQKTKELERNLLSNTMIYSTLITFLISFIIYISFYFIPFWKISKINILIISFNNLLNINNNFFLSFLYSITKLSKIPNKLYYLLLFLFLWVFLIPIYFVNVQSLFIPVFMYGIFVNYNFKPFPLIYLMIIVYYFLFLLPLINFIFLKIENNSSNKLIIFYKLIPIIFLIFWFGIMFFAGLFFTAFTSPLFFIGLFSLIYIFNFIEKFDNDFVNQNSTVQTNLLI